MIMYNSWNGLEHRFPIKPGVAVAPPPSLS